MKKLTKGLFVDSFQKNRQDFDKYLLLINSFWTNDINKNALQFLVGQGMKLSGGKANPESLQKLLKEKLGNKKPAIVFVDQQQALNTSK